MNKLTAGISDNLFGLDQSYCKWTKLMDYDVITGNPVCIVHKKAFRTLGRFISKDLHHLISRWWERQPKNSKNARRVDSEWMVTGSNLIKRKLLLLFYQENKKQAVMPLCWEGGLWNITQCSVIGTLLEGQSREPLTLLFLQA